MRRESCVCSAWCQCCMQALCRRMTAVTMMTVNLQIPGSLSTLKHCFPEGLKADNGAAGRHSADARWLQDQDHDPTCLKHDTVQLSLAAHTGPETCAACRR